MKKSLLTVITFVLVLINTVITVVLFLNMSNEVKSANELITKVCEAIELDVASSEANESAVPLDQTQSEWIIDSENKKLYVLKKGDDGKDHYVQLTCSIVLNTGSRAYETYGQDISQYQSRLQSIIQDVVSSQTKDDLLNDQKGVKEEIKDRMNSLFGASDFVLSVDFPEFTPQ